MFDADGLLATFMVKNVPNSKLFLANVGKLLEDAKKAARSKDQGLFPLEYTRRMMEAPQRHRPGDAVALRGIYQAHHSDHRQTHKMVVLESEFPFCAVCGDRVRYQEPKPSTRRSGNTMIQSLTNGIRPKEPRLSAANDSSQDQAFVCAPSS
jgi:hypothetical protein